MNPWTLVLRLVAKVHPTPTRTVPADCIRYWVFLKTLAKISGISWKKILEREGRKKRNGGFIPSGDPKLVSTEQVPGVPKHGPLGWDGKRLLDSAGG